MKGILVSHNMCSVSVLTTVTLISRPRFNMFMRKSDALVEARRLAVAGPACQYQAEKTLPRGLGVRHWPIFRP